MAAQQEIHRTFTLEADAAVKVSGIAGPVFIEATDGAKAEVHITRMAGTQRELQCYETAIANTAGVLTIGHRQHSSVPGCESIRARQQVRLKLPRWANVHLSTIGGSVDIGALDGLVKLQSVGGHVRVSNLRAAEMSGLAEGLSLTIGRLTPRGVQVFGVVGAIDAAFQGEADADVEVSSVVGAVRGDWAGSASSKAGEYRARVGAGGPPVSISGVVGPVTLRRLRTDTGG
jgi:hypothetical protein